MDCAKKQNKQGEEKEAPDKEESTKENGEGRKSITCTALISTSDLLCSSLIRRMFKHFWSEYLIPRSTAAALF